MAGKPPKQKEPNPWDRRPWPSARGSRDQGCGLRRYRPRAFGAERVTKRDYRFYLQTSLARPSYWARCACLAPCGPLKAAREMLRAASEAFFHGYSKAASPLLDDYKSVLRGATCFSQRRNDIAHGVVDYYRPEPRNTGSANAVRRYVRDVSSLFHLSGSGTVESVIATYCYTVNELEYFRLCFPPNCARALHDRTARVARVIQAPALREKYRRLVRGSANPKGWSNRSCNDLDAPTPSPIAGPQLQSPIGNRSTRHPVFGTSSG